MFKRIFTVLLLTMSLNASSANEENPEYNLELKEGDFSVRTYSPMLVAGAESRNRNGLFQVIADYIFGNNDRSEKIPMTSPVFTTSNGEVMTMMFYMPSRFQSIEDLPTPNNPRVKLQTFDLGSVAVITYGGYNSERKRYLNYQRLLQWAKDQNLEIKSKNYFSAGYDSPWVPGNKRTNEILIQLK